MLAIELVSSGGTVSYKEWFELNKSSLEEFKSKDETIKLLVEALEDMKGFTHQDSGMYKDIVSALEQAKNYI